MSHEPPEVAGADRYSRGQFRYRGSRQESAVAQLLEHDYCGPHPFPAVGLCPTLNRQVAMMFIA